MPVGATRPDTPVRVILARHTTKPRGYQLALITTDLTSTASQIVERYSDRWPIEVAFEHGNELFGVGDARNRTNKAVERTVPFQFLTMTLTTVWYAINCETELRTRVFGPDTHRPIGDGRARRAHGGVSGLTSDAAV
jgi:hypothetical protein